jgi:hypothetical protein
VCIAFQGMSEACVSPQKSRQQSPRRKVGEIVLESDSHFNIFILNLMYFQMSLPLLKIHSESNTKALVCPFLTHTN